MLHILEYNNNFEKHKYSRFWDKIQKNIMANVEKDIKVRPSVRQITQRMNFYEANIEKPKKHSVRILNDSEKTLVNEECQNYITRLERFGLLSPLKRELLIDKLTGIGFEPLDVEVVKALSILMLFQEPNIDVKLNTIEGDAFWESPSKLN